MPDPVGPDPVRYVSTDDIRRVAAKLLAVISVLLLVLGTVLPLWWEDGEASPESLLTIFKLFEGQTYASDSSRLLGVLVPIGFAGLLVCVALALMASAMELTVGWTRGSYRFARIVSGFLSVGTLVPVIMTLMGLEAGGFPLGMAFYLVGVVAYAGLCAKPLHPSLT